MNPKLLNKNHNLCSGSICLFTSILQPCFSVSTNIILWRKLHHGNTEFSVKVLAKAHQVCACIYERSVCALCAQYPKRILNRKLDFFFLLLFGCTEPWSGLWAWCGARWGAEAILAAGRARGRWGCALPAWGEPPPGGAASPPRGGAAAGGAAAGQPPLLVAALLLPSPPFSPFPFPSFLFFPFPSFPFPVRRCPLRRAGGPGGLPCCWGCVPWNGAVLGLAPRNAVFVALLGLKIDF